MTQNKVHIVCTANENPFFPLTELRRESASVRSRRATPNGFADTRTTGTEPREPKKNIHAIYTLDWSSAIHKTQIDKQPFVVLFTPMDNLESSVFIITFGMQEEDKVPSRYNKKKKYRKKK